MTSTAATGTGVGAGRGDRPAGYLEPAAVGEHLRQRVDVLDVTVAYGQATVDVEPSSWVAAVQLCRSDPALDCNFWEFLDAIDRGADGFDIVCHLYSVRHRHNVTLRTRVPGGRDKPRLPSVTGVYRGANWSERETYDMFGIEFEGHPGLLPRILTIEGFEGWPLRKDFLLSTREAKPWPGAKEPEERSEAGETADAGSVAPADAPVGPEDKAAAAKAKAERAKAKAAAMRAKKAQERAAAQTGAAPAPTGDPATGIDEAAGQAGGAGEDPDVAAQVEASDAQRTRPAEAAAAGAAAPGGDAIADAAERYGGGDTEGEAAAAAATAAGDPTASTPEGAAEVAGSAIAKDAAAGAAQGDMAARAPQDPPSAGEPIVNPEGEAKAAQGAAPVPGGTPGPEAEGRRGGAELQSGDRPAADTPGMTSPTQDAEAATTGTTPGRNEPPAPGPDSDVPADRGSRPPADGQPLVPAPGTHAAPLADDAPTEGADPRAGLDDGPDRLDDDPVAEHGASADAVEAPEAAPPASTGTDAADRGGPDYRRQAGTDDEPRAPEDRA